MGSGLADRIAQEKRARELEAISRDFLRSMRNMGWPGIPGEISRIMKEFAAENWVRMNRMVRLDAGIVYSWASEAGAITTGRKAASWMRTGWRIEFGVRGKDMFRTDLPIAIRTVPDELIDYAEPQCHPACGGIPMLFPDRQEFAKAHPEIAEDKLFAHIFN